MASERAGVCVSRKGEAATRGLENRQSFDLIVNVFCWNWKTRKKRHASTQQNFQATQLNDERTEWKKIVSSNQKLLYFNLSIKCRRGRSHCHSFCCFHHADDDVDEGNMRMWKLSEWERANGNAEMPYVHMLAEIAIYWMLASHTQRQSAKESASIWVF